MLRKSLAFVAVLFGALLVWNGIEGLGAQTGASVAYRAGQALATLFGVALVIVGVRAIRRGKTR